MGNCSQLTVKDNEAHLTMVYVDNTFLSDSDIAHCFWTRSMLILHGVLKALQSAQ